MNDILTKFETYLLTEKRVAANTFAAYKNDLDQFAAFVARRNLTVHQLSPDVLKDFVYELVGNKMSARTMSRKITALKIFFAFQEERFGLVNHAQDLLFPKLDKRLPNVLSEQEIDLLFQAADTDATDAGFRNKVMLSLLYVSGMRISELVSLCISNFQFDTGFITVNGKGGKGRMIPLPQEMLTMVDAYLRTVHKSFIHAGNGDRGTDFLFPIYYAGKVKHITRQAFWIILKQIWQRSGIQRTLSPHTLRHSFATHMLQRGADLRSLQILLGHENIGTVQIYTHVETSFLRDMYDKKHPRS